MGTDVFHVWNEDGQQFSVENGTSAATGVRVTENGDLILSFNNGGAAGFAARSWSYFEFDIPDGVDLDPVNPDR